MGADLAGHARGPGAGARRHQRRARPDLDVGRDVEAVRDATWRPTGATGTTTRSSGTRFSRSRTRNCGRRGRRCASYLFAFIRERARQRWTERQASPGQVVAAGTLLDPDALTIGFARRFTGYKRPELIFHDPDRLAAILSVMREPVQIVFAGKAHPADDAGKHHLQRIYKRAIDTRFGGRIAFVDDYDLHVAHFLVQGCDVWLNTPRKPLEASGTSGMKAAVNGVPHLSIGDGWWAEGYTGANGWLIDAPVAERRPGRAGRRRRRRALPRCSRSRSCRPSTTATRTGSRAPGCAS